MRVWKWGHAEENDEWVAAVGGNFPEISLGFNGESRSGDWEVLKLEGIHRASPPLKSDSPWFCAHVPLLSDRAKGCLADLMEGRAELLPADFGGQRLWLVNVWTLPDCIDYERSVFEVLPSTGAIHGFREYQFREEAIRGLDIFRIRDELRFRPCVSDRFVERVRECGLVGLEFELIWDSELPPGGIVFDSICT